MRRRAERAGRKQAPKTEQTVLGGVRQLLLPMVAGMVAAKQDLMSWVHQVGLAALKEILAADAERIAGPKGRHQPSRAHHHWGNAETELSFGGRRIRLERPRVRGNTGEMKLPSLEHFRQVDPLPERVVNQILLGVSTRGYESSLEPKPLHVRSRGISKSAASRHLVEHTAKKAKQDLSRRLEGVDLIAMMLDGIEVAGQAVVVALGIKTDGAKVPLGLWQGSTENAAVCTSLLQDLLSRGLKVEGRIFCVIDGGKGIRKALDDVFGRAVIVQRCQVHKLRNLRDHLPKNRHAYVIGVMREAYKSTSADTARKRLKALVAWLEENGHADAASSLREGMEETLTVLKLSLPPSLRRFLATTNAIENLHSHIRRVCRNVKRWRGGDMVRRWISLAMFSAEERFRRIRGYKELPALVRALRGDEQQLDGKHEAA